MPPARFSVLSYNVLHSFGASRLLAGRGNAAGAVWPQERLLRVAERVQELRPDVACFQEVDEAGQTALEHSLGDDFECAASMRNEALPPKDGCVVFVRKSRFEVLEAYPFRLRDTIEHHCAGISAADPEHSGSGLSMAAALWRELGEKLNLGVAVRLRSRSSTDASANAAEPQVCVATSHLYWDPRFPDLKLMQAFLLARELEIFAAKGGGDSVPLVLTGDFNSTPLLEEENFSGHSLSGVYQLLTQGSVPVTHPHHPVTLRLKRGILKGVSESDVPLLRLSQPFRSAYVDALGAEAPVTNVSAKFSGCLDYIMHRPGGAARVVDGANDEVDTELAANGGASSDRSNPLQVVRVQRLPSMQELAAHLPLPSADHPSDHLPLLAEFELASPA